MAPHQIYTPAYFCVQSLRNMQDNFTFTLVSDDSTGGNFYTLCNEMLDFQTVPYEVCMREIFISYGAWDNVRPGSNWTGLRDAAQLPWKYVYEAWKI